MTDTNQDKVIEIDGKKYNLTAIGRRLLIDEEFVVLIKYMMDTYDKVDTSNVNATFLAQGGRRALKELLNVGKERIERKVKQTKPRKK